MIVLPENACCAVSNSVIWGLHPSMDVDGGAGYSFVWVSIMI
jgi:hypothetical protein